MSPPGRPKGECRRAQPEGTPGGLPLAGLRVLDLTNVMAGPFCTYQLAQLGADVVKIERPRTGDLARQLGADASLNARGMGASFLAQNAGKRSMTLDLKHAEGKAAFLALAAKADAVVESYRPGVMRRLGLGHDVLRAANPRLVVCALSGFGQEGPLSARPAYDQIIQGMSGIMSVTGDEASAPLRVGFPVSDAIAGLNAALAVSAALAGAARTGKGALVDVSMLDSTLACAAWVVSNHLITGQTPRPMGNANRTASPSGTFRSGDGLLNIAANRQEQWEGLARVAGLEPLLSDPRFADREQRLKHRDELAALLERALAARPAIEWEALLNEAGVPCGRVLDVPEALALPQLRARDFIHRFPRVPGVEGEVAVTHGGYLLPDEGRPALSPPPRLGEHTRALLAEVGYDDEAIDALARQGVL